MAGQLIGILENNEIVYVKGDIIYLFNHLTQEYIDDRNDIDTVIDFYGFLWQEAVQDGTTLSGAYEYCQGLIDSFVGSGSLFIGHHVSSYVELIDRIGNETLEEHFGCTIKGYEFVGTCTTSAFDRKFSHLFSQEPVEGVIE
jgi:hypothetical protein